MDAHVQKRRLAAKQSDTDVSLEELELKLASAKVLPPATPVVVHDGFYAQALKDRAPRKLEQMSARDVATLNYNPPQACWAIHRLGWEMLEVYPHMSPQ